MSLEKLIDLDRLSRFKSALDNQIGDISYLGPGTNLVDAINNTYNFVMDLADRWKPLALLVIDDDQLVLNMNLGNMAPNGFINYGTNNDLQKLARIYLQGLHLEFYLPHSMLDDGAQDQFASFRIEDLQANASTFQITSMTLSATVEGTLYWAALTPVSNYVMSGTLYSREIPIAETDANVEDMLDSFGLDYTSSTTTVNEWTGGEY